MMTQLELQGHRTQGLEGVFVYVGSDARPLSVLGLEEPGTSRPSCLAVIVRKGVMSRRTRLIPSAEG